MPHLRPGAPACGVFEGEESKNRADRLRLWGVATRDIETNPDLETQIEDDSRGVECELKCAEARFRARKPRPVRELRLSA